MPSPLGRAIKLATSPSGRKVIGQTIRLARSKEGRQLLDQARKVARSAEGRKLVEQAKHLAKLPAEAARAPETKDRLATLRSRLLKRS